MPTLTSQLFTPTPQRTLREIHIQSFLREPNISNKICVVVPAYNEEKVIGSSLRALSQVVDQKNIFVVSDGSSDQTAKIAAQYTSNVLDLKLNRGKSLALESLIKTYNLLFRYEYVMFADADSRLVPNFMEHVYEYMTARPACIVGTVTSHRKGLISAYRVYEYGLCHRIVKKAQNALGVITVAPGCASLYRSDVLAKLDFSHQTLTEDFDLTLQIHKKKLGQIVYATKAVVTTQDPPTIKDYWKQVNRWYTGFWQNIWLHRIFIPKKRVDFELLLMIGDAFSWVVAIAIALTHPLLFLGMLLLSYLLIIVLAVVIVVIEKKYWALLYLPYFPLFQYINIASYTYAFCRVLKNRNKMLSWQKVDRYAVA